ncbi:MAG TPA: alpha/beta hydrolase [Acidimicrobiia bacterium]|nr:alpha/beta hydrolase [Acidimicrobiia bacterium]
MALHPSAEMMVQLLSDAGLTFTLDATPESRRAAMIAATTNPAFPKHPVHDVGDRTIPGPEGDIPVRVFRPSAAPGLPVLLWFHGGGWVTGNLDTHDQLGRLLADEVGAVVVSVDYRLAPEAKFPAAADDCLAVYEWALAHADEVGGDASRIAIGGDSAGGNLAAVVALDARERGLPQPKLQLLVYPVTEVEFDSASMIDNAKGYFLEADSMRWFWDHYARTPADFDDPRFSPLHASDHSGLARAVVITAEYDPLRDQGEAYARKLAAAEVPTEAVRADGLIHGFFGMHEFMPPGRDAWVVAVAALRDALGADA